jgi:uncharacterized protein YndB with AHSA1/START domain
VARPVEEVFDYLADATNEARWNPWARWVRKISEGPVQQGAVFRGSYKGFGELDQDLSVYERPRRVVYHSIPKGMRDATMSFELQAEGGATSVRITGDAEPRGLMKAMEPLMGLRMRPHLRDVAAGISRELGAASA